MRRSRLRRVVPFAAALMLLIGGRSLLELQGLSHEETKSNFHFNSRHLLAPVENCTPRAYEEFPTDFFPYEVRKQGAVLLHAAITIYVFAALAIVCDEYFVASIEKICNVLNLQEDVAGSTFMAVGSSSPELFTSLIGLMVAKSDVGVGAIVGSAVFNLLFTVGLVGLAGGMVIHLTVWPIVRDCLCYIIALVCLLIVMVDQQIHWYECCVMLMLYVMYILLMAYNRKVSNYLKSVFGNKKARKTPTYDEVNERCPLIASQNGVLPNHNHSALTHAHNKENGDIIVTTSLREHIHKGENNGGSVEENVECVSPLVFPESCLGRCFYLVMFPVKILFFLTVPDCKRWQKLYLLTFAISVAWIAGLTYIIVWMVTIIGDTWDIPDTVMGVTLLAAGSSLPDSLNSLLAARQGFGEMAISNPIGSNIFDVMFGLGFPWFLQTAVIDAGSVVSIGSTGLVVGVGILVGSTMYLLGLTLINRWTVDKKYALFCLLGYAVVTVLLCLFELNVFGYYNPPPCPRIGS